MYFWKPQIPLHEMEVLHASMTMSANNLIEALRKNDSKYMNTPWTKDNPIIIYPHTAKWLWLAYMDTIPVEYKWLWVVVSPQLNKIIPYVTTP